MISFQGFRKLRTVFLVVSLPLIGCSLVVAGVLRYGWLAGDMEAGLVSRMNNAASRLSVNMEVPFWRYDVDYAGTVITTEMTDSAIQVVQVFDAADGSLFSDLKRTGEVLARTGGTSKYEPAPGEYVVETPILREGKPVASIRLIYCDDEIQRSLAGLAVRSMLEAALLLVILGAVISVLLQVLISKPLGLDRKSVV